MNSDKGRRDIDWAAIWQDYRAGVLSLRDMAKKHGCAHSTIANFAARHAWSRDNCVRGDAGAPCPPPWAGHGVAVVEHKQAR
jgi:uncharacterized protein YjcR